MSLIDRRIAQLKDEVLQKMEVVALLDREVAGMSEQRPSVGRPSVRLTALPQVRQERAVELRAIRSASALVAPHSKGNQVREQAAPSYVARLHRVADRPLAPLPHRHHITHVSVSFVNRLVNRHQPGRDRLLKEQQLHEAKQRRGCPLDEQQLADLGVRLSRPARSATSSGHRQPDHSLARNLAAESPAALEFFHRLHGEGVARLARATATVVQRYNAGTEKCCDGRFPLRSEDELTTFYKRLSSP
jgi:hypothetical protein